MMDMNKQQAVWVEHTTFAVTKIANGRVLRSEDGELIRSSFVSSFGSGIPVVIQTNQHRDPSLRRVLEAAERLRPPPIPARLIEPDDPNDEVNFTFNDRPLLPVSLWSSSTVYAMNTVRGEVVPALVEQLRASGFLGAATLGIMARSALYLYRQGLTSYGEETDSELTITARTPDGTGSGWHGAANREWGRIAAPTVAARAAEITRLSRSPVMLEPGRRTAILGPAAVAQLVYAMAPAFAGALVRSRQSPLSDLSGGDRTTKLGRQVVDPRIVMTSDPADPLGGYLPFFELGGIEYGIFGYPTAATTWIDRGILTNLAYNVGGSVQYRLPAVDIPRSVHLRAAPGTHTATIEEMITNCKDGIYVNRFSNVNVVDNPSMLMTGVTRDGCFLVKDGKIVKPVKNFRFLESPFFSFNKLEMIGDAERVAFGLSREAGELRIHWPQLPVIVPPMMIRDFNFSGIADMA